MGILSRLINAYLKFRLSRRMRMGLPPGSILSVKSITKSEFEADYEKHLKYIENHFDTLMKDKKEEEKYVLKNEKIRQINLLNSRWERARGALGMK